MSKFVPKHINHKFQQDYINLIERLKSNNSLNIRTIIPETQKIIDSHVDSYYKMVNSSTNHHNNPKIKPQTIKPIQTKSQQTKIQPCNLNENSETKIIVHVNNDDNLKMDLAKLTVENDALKAEIDKLNQIIIQLYKENFEMEQELKQTLEGIAN